jgi:hypothetical protein
MLIGDLLLPDPFSPPSLLFLVEFHPEGRFWVERNFLLQILVVV